MNVDVTIAQRREAEALVVAGVFVVADANAGGIEQADHDGEHLLARQTWQCQVALQDAPQLGELLAEGHHTAECCAVAKLAPVGVITILFAPSSVAAGGLQMGRAAASVIHTSRYAGGIASRAMRCTSSAAVQRIDPGGDIAKARLERHSTEPGIPIGNVDETCPWLAI